MPPTYIPITITPPTLNNYTYYLGNNYLVISFANFTVEGLTICSTSNTTTYSSLLSSSAALPSFITFYSTNQSYVIITNNPTKEGVYTIGATATASGYSRTGYFTLTVIPPCYNPALVIPSVLTDQTYIISQSPLVYSMPAFSVNDSTCTISYSLTLSNGAAIDSSFATFNAAAE